MMLFPESKNPQKLEQIKTHPFYASCLKEIEDLYNQFCTKPFPRPLYSDMMLYYKTGSRIEYERLYFQRRAWIDTLFMRYYIHKNEQDLSMLEDAIWTICDEYTWALPAHFDINLPEDEKRNFIDLFAAETGQMLSEIYYILGDTLSKQIRKRIEDEMDRRILSSFENTVFHWETLTINWSAVCAGNVGMAFIYMAPDRFAGVWERIHNALNCFLSGYGEDGACTEGHGYWTYGFGYFVYFAQLLYEFNGTDLLHTDKIHQIVLFQQRVLLRNDTVISFSDGAQHMRFQPGLTYLLKRYYPDVQIPDMKFRLNLLEERDTYRFAPFVRMFFWTDPDVETGLRPESGFYFEDAQWYINKKEKYSFVAKGGHNDEAHNHNDLGSFIIATDDGQILADIGAGEYTKDYFTWEGRYTYLCNASSGHSVPIIDGEEQKFGRQYTTKAIEHSDNAFEISLEKGYEHDTLSSLRRRFELDEDGVTLTDNFEFSDNQKHQITERFIALIEPQNVTDGVQIGSVLIKCDATPHITKTSIKDHNAEDLAVYLIDYEVDSQFKIRFSVN